MVGRKKRRIGLVLATIHAGSSLKVWPHMADSAEREGDSFFIFPGGKLDYANGADNLRNSIFSLVNSDNLDGLISWSSAIGSNVSAEELEQFHLGFKDLPFVTIGTKIKNHPYAWFDAYSGMKELTEHFIREHKVKKIAYIRGPVNHVSSEDRYRAFVDTLKENNLYIEENIKLISDAFSWDDGRAAIKQLCEERKLVPGKDFEAIIAASDMMAMAVFNYLSEQGYKIPKDVKLGGFNDAEESHVCEVPFTTVHMPKIELGDVTGSMIYEVLSGNPSVSDVYLPSSIVIRESCGCNTLQSVSKKNKKSSINIDKNKLREELFVLLKQNGLEGERYIEELVDSYYNKNLDEYFRVLPLFLKYYFSNYPDTKVFLKIVDLFRDSGVLLEKDSLSVELQSYLLLMQFEDRLNAKMQYDASQLKTALNHLKLDLMSVHTRSSLVEFLAKTFPAIGIKTASIVLYKDDNFSECIGSFCGDKVNLESELFPNGKLYPASIEEHYNSGVFIVQPLFMENEPLGYMITSYAHFDGGTYEDLRATVSSTLQSIFMFEEINSAKQVAEQAEFAKTEFFANVGSDLCDPLKELESKLDQLEKNLDADSLSKDILLEQILFIKSQIGIQREKTETLVDLTRSQVDDLPMNKTLFDIRESLPKTVAVEISGDLPLLYGDSSRLEKALSIIAEESQSTLSVSAELFGMQIYLECAHLNWLQPALLLAEKIIMLQYGEVIKTKNSCTIILPWPNLSCLPPVKQNSLPKKIYSLSSETNQRVQFGLPIDVLKENDYSNVDNSEPCLLSWEPDSSAVEDWFRVYSMRKHSVLFRTPILCFSKELSGHEFMEVIESKVREQKTDPILFIGTKSLNVGTWVNEHNSISISSMEDFEHILTEFVPSLIVFKKADEEAIKVIRQNPKTVLVPIIVIPDVIDSEEQVDLLCSHPRIVLCNKGAAESEQFSKRVKEILSGDDILPPHTGALVKKAIFYLNQNASSQIVRWKLADYVHVSEDYLTRIFHKELGLSLWEYLNRFRIHLATRMLLETNDTIYEIAENSGFQDQAYFCRVFKKIYGVPPGKIRQK